MTEMQTQLLQEYVRIEKFKPPVWDMRLKKSQIDAKGFIFRVIEELGEAYESLIIGDEINFWTELADATHFLLELGIVTGCQMPSKIWVDIWEEAEPSEKFDLDYDVIRTWFWDITYKLTLVSNAMRNKQWKNTEILPDMVKFKELMDKAFYSFFSGFEMIGASEYQVYGWYWRKNQVNQFRIRSNY